MKRRQWYYRGSLNFCNYSCSYCPFAKQKYSASCLEKDKAEWERFVDSIEQRHTGEAACGEYAFEEAGEFGAVLVVPYGEALVHDYYWEGLARLSRLSYIEYVGAQSNFSFSVHEKLSLYQACSGKVEKLRLWGTFHPEMVDIKGFLNTCNQLESYQLNYCVGAVGVPEQLDLLATLRRELSDKRYLWINKMDGLQRSYYKEEIEAFTRIDPYFSLELRHHRRRGKACGRSYFVTADGELYGCNISNYKLGNLYEKQGNELERKKEQGQEKENESKLKKGEGCSKRECSCYLSYNNLHEKELLFFEPYPAFRVPDYKKALIFDIDGTLLFKGEATLSDVRVKQLSFLAQQTKLYVATSLPYEASRCRLKKAFELFSGGVFANGGRIVIKNACSQNASPSLSKNMDVIRPILDSVVLDVKQLAKKQHLQCHIYRRGTQCYKLTLRKHRGRVEKGSWENEQLSYLREQLLLPADYVMLVEGDCLQITAKNTGKLNGILFLLKHLGLSKDEIGFFGNGDNDVEALKFFPFSVAVENSSEAARQAAKLVL